MSQPKELVGSVRLVGYWGDFSPSRYSFVVLGSSPWAYHGSIPATASEPDPFWKFCSEKNSLQHISQTTSMKNPTKKDFPPVCSLNLRRSSGALEPESLL
jgi:hypothetical protein